MALQSWVEGASGPHGFGLNHLPYGAFRRDEHTRLCVRIGEFALDLDSCVRHGLLENVPTSVRHACAQPDLHALLAAGPEAWRSLRGALIEILSDADGYAAHYPSDQWIQQETGEPRPRRGTILPPLQFLPDS